MWCPTARGRPVPCAELSRTSRAKHVLPGRPSMPWCVWECGSTVIYDGSWPRERGRRVVYE
eukprot:8614024-Pyramimonas_sp.AAC.1